MYQALASQTNYVSTSLLRPTDTCACDACRAAVAAASAADAAAGAPPWSPPSWLRVAADSDAPATHDDNEWGISVAAGEEAAPPPTAPTAPPATHDASLDDLAAELAALTRDLS